MQTYPKPNIDAQDVPIIGGWTGKIGRLKGIAAIQCSPTPEVAVFAFWHQIPYLVYTLLAPDCESIIVDGYRGSGHRHRRGVHVKDGVAVEGQPPGKGWGWKYWKLYDLKEKVGWFFLIVDGTIEFEINWMTTAYAWSGCPTDSPQWASWDTGPDPFVVGGGEDWHPFPMVLQAGHTIAADQTQFACDAGKAMAVRIAIQCVPGPGQPNTVPISIRLVDDLGGIWGAGDADDPGDGTQQTTILTQILGRPTGPTVFTLMASKPAGLYYITGSSWTASGLIGKWSNPVPCLDSILKYL